MFCVAAVATAVLLAQASDAPVAAPSAVTETPAPAPRRGGAFLYGGAIAFGVAYVPMAAIGVESLRFGHGEGAVLFIPVAGPFISAIIESRRNAHPYLITLLVVDGVIQTAGAALAFVGWRQRIGPTVAVGMGPAGAPLGITVSAIGF